jgi:EpsI family protein
MLDRRTILVPVFLLAQAALVHWATGRERAPAPPALGTFPAAFGEWRQFTEDPIAADVAAELRADQVLSRSYVYTSTPHTSAQHISSLYTPTGPVIGLFVAWFQSQRAGASQPHSPKVCLPASGWIPAVTGEVAFDTAAGAITVNRYIVVNHGQRDVVLYWYQGPRRVTAGEWAAKLWLIADGLRDKRTDTALVRVVAQSGDGGDQAATAVATAFAQSLYPLLRANLPQ